MKCQCCDAPATYVPWDKAQWGKPTPGYCTACAIKAGYTEAAHNFSGTGYLFELSEEEQEAIRARASEQRKEQAMSVASNYHPLPHQLAGHTVHIEGPQDSTAAPWKLTVRDLTTGEEITNCVKVEIICDVSEPYSLAHLTLADLSSLASASASAMADIPHVTVDVPCTFALSAEVRSLSARPQRE